MTSKLLRNSTAMALVLAMGLPIQPAAVYAQEQAVDCAATPEHEACQNGGAAPAEAAPVEEAPAEAAPAVEAAPEASAPAEQPVEAPAAEGARRR